MFPNVFQIYNKLFVNLGVVATAFAMTIELCRIKMCGQLSRLSFYTGKKSHIVTPLALAMMLTLSGNVLAAHNLLDCLDNLIVTDHGTDGSSKTHQEDTYNIHSIKLNRE